MEASGLSRDNLILTNDNLKVNEAEARPALGKLFPIIQTATFPLHSLDGTDTGTPESPGTTLSSSELPQSPFLLP